MRLGVHIRVAKGLLDGLALAERLGCETVQLFSSNPASWRRPRLDPESCAEFAAKAADLGIYPVIVHTPYLLNLASPDPGFWSKTVELLVFALERAAMLKARYVVTHIGSHRGVSYEEGVLNIRRAILRSLDLSKGQVMVLLEAGAGMGQSIGSTFEQLQDIFAVLPDEKRLGTALDTAHLWGAGYDISTREKLDAVISDFDRKVGLARLKLVHLNDTRCALGSKRDRHWHIGEGCIGIEGFKAVLNHPALAHLPGILETPGHDFETDNSNLRRLRELQE